jgi:anti-sigma B factor antagonist
MALFYITDEMAAENADDDAPVVLAAGGELDYHASPTLRERIATHISAGKRRVVLDISTVTFIDSTAIGVLIASAVKLQDMDHGSLAVVCASDNRKVLRIFDIAGVASLIALHPSREEALSALAMAG